MNFPFHVARFPSSARHPPVDGVPLQVALELAALLQGEALPCFEEVLGGPRGEAHARLFKVP